jgi:hypothetical protein
VRIAELQTQKVVVKCGYGQYEEESHQAPTNHTQDGSQRAPAENLAKGMTAEKAITISNATTQQHSASHSAY